MSNCVIYRAPIHFNFTDVSCKTSIASYTYTVLLIYSPGCTTEWLSEVQLKAIINVDIRSIDACIHTSIRKKHFNDLYLHTPVIYLSL